MISPHQKRKHLFIGLSLLSVGSLIGSFAGQLTALEIYQQKELGAFNTLVTRTYVIASSTRVMPYGFSRDKAKLIAQVHEPYTTQKLLLLATAIGTSIGALLIGKESLPLWESEDSIRQLQVQGVTELRQKAIKHELAMKSKLQHYVFADEIRQMIDTFGSTESELLEVDDLLLDESLSEEETTGDHAENETVQDDSLVFRSQFPETMDATSWKACLKALSDGCSKEQIILEVLGGGSLAEAFYEHLKSKFI